MKKSKLGLNGRIVIPKSICQKMNLQEGSPLIITLEDSAIVVRPDQLTCGLCGAPIASERTPRLCDGCIRDALKYHSQRNSVGE